MASGRVTAFLDHLRQTQLLDQTQIDEAGSSPLARGEDPVPLARDLVQRKWLTAYQTNQVLNGRGKELLLGPYRVVDRLGEGGMGQVFKAYHGTMKRLVALKVIRKDRLSNPQAVKRFYQEVQIAAQLVHPNIVLAFDAGQAGDTHYFAMEYVDGIDLARLVQQKGPLPVADAGEFIRQAALGLQHAHERGLVHRDIKPANLLLSKASGGRESSEPSGGLRPPLATVTVKILDLGLARLSGEQAGGMTREGSVLGTPDFLAPEQALNARGVDIRADIYSLGCTFYFLLTGQPPFQAEALTEVLLKHQTEEPTPVEKLRPEVPAPISAIVHKMLAKKPEDRYQTPGEAAEALGNLVRKKGARPAASAAQANGKAASKLTPLPTRWKKIALVAAAGLAGFVFLAILVGALSRNDESKSVSDSSSSKYKVTGATQTLQPKSAPAVDLMPLIKPADDWKIQNNLLVSPQQFLARLQIPYKPPDEYALSAVVERVVGNNAAAFTLLGGNTQFMVMLDGWPDKGYRSGLCALDHRMPDDQPKAEVYQGPLFTNNKTSEVVCTVRKSGLTVVVDGKKVISYSGSWQRLSIPPFLGLRPPDPNGLYLSTSLFSVYRFSQLKLTPLRNP